MQQALQPQEGAPEAISAPTLPQGGGEIEEMAMTEPQGAPGEAISTFRGDFQP